MKDKYNGWTLDINREKKAPDRNINNTILFSYSFIVH